MHPLLTQLASAAALVLLMTLVHGAGVVGIAHWLGLDQAQRQGRRINPRTTMILCAVALLLFALHMVEITLFALFYLAVGALTTFEEALYFSASAYSTLAQPETHFPVNWRLAGALEGLIGFLMIGWSTAFLVTDMNRMLRR